MRINFIVPSLNLSGGLRVISIYADLLRQRGHEVTVISPGEEVLSLWQRIKSFIKGYGWKKEQHFFTDFFDKIEVDLKILDSCRSVNENDVPDADIVIATFWTTAEWVSTFSKKKGRKVYFVQGHEIFPGFPIERVKSTLRLPFHKIAISQWLVDVMREQYGDNNITLVPNGVDTIMFTAPTREKNRVPTVGFIYSPVSIKGADVAIKSIEQARKKIPNLKIVAFGQKQPVSDLPLPENTEFFLCPDQNKIKNIYARCDAWLFASRSEGFGLPILEAMACRTPVIGTAAGAAPELLVDGGGILVDIEDSKMMAEAIIMTSMMNDIEWRNMSDKAYAIAGQHTWDKSVVLLENALKSISNHV